MNHQTPGTGDPLIMPIARKTKSAVRILVDAVQSLQVDAGLSYEEVEDVIRSALLAAYRKKYQTSENAEVIIDMTKSQIVLKSYKIVVERVLLDGMQINIEDAQVISKDVVLGDKIDVVEDIEAYSRIATQIGVKVAAQKLREFEQKKIRQDYEHKVGELINGYIIRKKGNICFVNLAGNLSSGTVEGIMPLKHQVPTEKYRLDDRIKVLLYSIEEDRGKTIKIIVSRADKNFIHRLFEMEVPEIYENIVQIKSIGRVPGIRSKVVVDTNMQDIDPVGACVGMKGVRIRAIIRELGNERIDIVEYSSSLKTFVTNAMSPAKPTLVKVDAIAREAIIVVPDKDLSLAIGREGSNVKLASYITNCKIDIKNESDFSQEMVTPQAKRSFDELFSTDDSADTAQSNIALDDNREQEEQKILLSEVPGISKRILKILNENDIKYVEDLLALQEDSLIDMEGIGKATAEKILEIVSESIEFEEEEDNKDLNARYE